MKRPVKLPALVGGRFGDRRQTSSERAQPLNQPGDVRANGCHLCLIVKPHDLARSFTLLCALCRGTSSVPAHDTIRGRRRALYGTALNSGHMSSSR